MRRHAAGVFLLVLLLPACPGPSTGGSDGGPSCPQGRRVAPGAVACEPVVPDAACPPGTMVVVGQAECQPVLSSECAQGYDPDPSGWGCAPVMPADACAGASLGPLGSADCVPLGDCAAAFPPANATHFVDASLSDTEVDATHFQTIGAALAAAPAGSTIAIERGTYVEALDFAGNATLIGRCAEEVVIDDAGGLAGGVEVFGPRTVELEGLTIRGHRGGVVAVNGARVTLRRVLLEENRELGLLAATAGTQVTVEDSVIRDTRLAAAGSLGRAVDVEQGAQVTLRRTVVAGAGSVAVFATDAGSALTLEQTVVRDVRGDSSGQEGRGLYVVEGARATLVESVVHRARDIGVFLGHSGTRVELRDSVVRETQLEGGQFGRGVQVQNGAEVVLIGTTLADNHDTGLSMTDAGSRATAEDLVVARTRPVANGSYGFGLFIREGAQLQLTGGALVDGAVGGALFLGADTSASLQRVVIAGTGADPALGFGTALAVLDSAQVSLHTVNLADSEGTGLYVDGARSLLAAEAVSVLGTSHDPQLQFAHAIVVLRGARISLTNSVVSASGGIGLAVAEATGTVSGSLIADNTVGVHAQAGTTLREVDVAPDDPPLLDLAVTRDTVFRDNGTRVGSGVVELPQVSF